MFKLGDKVRLIKDNHTGFKKGEIFIVSPKEEMSIYWIIKGKVLVDPTHYVLDELFELVVEPFNYLTDPWKIRTGDTETSKRVQEFLFAQGIYWNGSVSGKVINGFKDQYVTNLVHGGTVSEGVIRYGTTLNEFEGIQATEIILTFETVVKSVEYIPVVAKKTDAEIATDKAKIALESLMIKIDELSKEATKLQNIISGEVV